MHCAAPREALQRRPRDAGIDGAECSWVTLLALAPVTREPVCWNVRQRALPRAYFVLTLVFILGDAEHAEAAWRRRGRAICGICSKTTRLIRIGGSFDAGP